LIKSPPTDLKDPLHDDSLDLGAKEILDLPNANKDVGAEVLMKVQNYKLN